MTDILLAVGVGLLVGVGLAGLAAWLVIRQLNAAVEWHRKQEQVATDRLVHAWKDGATIPPRPSEPVPSPEPLPSVLQEELDQWEDGEHRTALEAHMRRGLHEGLGTTAILLGLDNLHP